MLKTGLAFKNIKPGFTQQPVNIFFQPKLAINPPNDKCEQEADATADKVMRMQQQPINTVRRKCTDCEKEEQQIQREEMHGKEAVADNNLDHYVGGLNAGGQSLPGAVKNFYEPKFGYDFSNVKIHTDNNAARSAQSINALAYTSGNNIVFNKGEYDPGTEKGKRLLGHELTHVVQQEAGISKKIQKAEDWDFTLADYKKLKTAKQDLKFDTDSSWVPSKLQENILATIKFVLTAIKPERTKGVNTKDFFHGHLVIPNDAVPKGFAKKISTFTSDKRQLEADALGGDWANDVTKSNLGAFTKAMKNVEKLATPLLTDAIAVKGAAVIYHSFEYNMPDGMKAGDPVRNIKTDIGANPAGFSPPDPNGASSYLKDFTAVLQFAFLVDEKGIIHVTVGTISNLSKVTGTALK